MAGVSPCETPPRAGPWLWLLAMGAGPGLTLWAARTGDPAALLLRDEWSGSRAWAGLWVLASVAAVLGLWVLAARGRGWRAGLVRVVGRWRWLAGVPLLLLLRYEPAGLTGPLAPLLIVLCGGLAGWSVYACSDMSVGTGAKVQARLVALAGSRRAGLWLLGAAYAGVLARLVQLGLYRHHALASKVFDLGIYDNLMWNNLHGRVLGSAFARGGTHVMAHVDPVLLLLTPIYALAPGAEVMIVVQAAVVLSGALPVFLLAQRRLGRAWLSLVLGLAYLLHPSVHGAVLFDVHSLALAAPLCLWAIDLLERERWWGYAAMVGLLLATREDLALWCVGLGLYAGLGRGAWRVGAATVGASLVYFTAIKWLVQLDPYPYEKRYAAFMPGGEGGFSAVAASLVSNPWHALIEVLTGPKLVFLAVVLAPLMLLPLLAGRRWWTFGFGLAFTLLASNAMNYAPLSHYTVMLFPALFAATPAAIARGSRWVGRVGGDVDRAVRALGVAVLVAASLTTLRLGALLENGSFRGWPHALSYHLDATQLARLAWLREVRRGLPATASVVVSNHVGAHFTARDTVFMYPGVKDADWLILHRMDVSPKGGAVDVGRLTRRGYVLEAQWADEIFVLRRIES